ncbi:ATP-dependent DNA helicase DDM1-like isoform X1 [Schistocerca americana]|uniref:ATP-dependent DNA helicase DDM1-like isoform X1 n=1 Tax=Schistocerca americana TaxID=7009 RepID=UPI001F4FAE65|nr:ATP-dependent DNA helicase DDM1-like isoform X1 [Schistocerca americana]XP_049939838.1 uncharacterized protein LOC126416255 isoform X1 [Schistocerca serialis cubense]
MPVKVKMFPSVVCDEKDKSASVEVESVHSEDWRGEELSECSGTLSEADSEQATTSSGFSEDGSAIMAPRQNSVAERLKEQVAKLDELLVIVEKVSAVVKAIFEANEKQKKEGAFHGVDAVLQRQNSEALKNETLFIGTLSPHQIDGVKWMKVLDDHELSGILADEMGMGKTVQVIAFICLLLEQNISGPFLIVTPLSVLNNWESEFQRFAPKIPVVKFAGSKDQRMSLYPKLRRKTTVLTTDMTPVVLTSYDIALREQILAKFDWRFIIVDEGHRLKNAKSKLYNTLKFHRSRSRLLLTGTPLQNDINELWALLRFVLPKIFPEENLLEDYLKVSDFQGNAEMEEDKRSVINKVHQLLLPFILRRVKSGNMLGLPPKKEMVIYVPLTRTQLDLYQSTLDGSIIKKFNKKEEEEEEDLYGPRKKRRCTLNKRPFYDSDTSNSDDDSDPGISEKPRVLSKTMEDKLINECRNSTCEVLLHRELLRYSALTEAQSKKRKEDYEENPYKGYPELWYVDIIRRMSAIPLPADQSFEDLPLENIFMRELLFYRSILESTDTHDNQADDKFRGYPDNVVNSILSQMSQHPVPEDLVEEGLTACSDSCDGYVVSVKQPLNSVAAPLCNVPTNVTKISSDSEGNSRTLAERYGYSVELTPLNMGMQLRKISNHPYLVRMPVSNGCMVVTDDLVTSSGKFMVLKALLPRFKQGGHKVLIFSTFKKVLDLLEVLLESLGYSYCRLDGASSLDERTENVNEFCNQENIFAFLISTRAGGLGLNLVAADTVIIFDSDWNPQADLQAQDRCHRIGQKKPVNVYRLVTKGTIDEVIMKTAVAKRKLEKVVILEGKFNLTADGANTELDRDKLRHLLQESLAHCVIDSGDSVLKPHQIERLLKRRKFPADDDEDSSSSEVEDLTELA